MSANQILVHALGGKCVTCGSTDNLELHHTDRDHKNNALQNIQLLCRKCHAKTYPKKKPKIKVKAKINVTIEESLLKKLDAAVKTQKFRNRSHAVELGLMKLLEEA